MSIVAIGIFNIPVFARITRGAANAVWAREYVLAARAAGKGRWRITLDHVLPNIASQLIVQATIASPPPSWPRRRCPTWAWARSRRSPAGAACSTRRRPLMFQAPMLAVYPGVAIVLSVLGLNLMGDGLRDLLDPKLARRR
jgi:peptide/nickel transport system permease protein